MPKTPAPRSSSCCRHCAAPRRRWKRSGSGAVEFSVPGRSPTPAQLRCPDGRGAMLIRHAVLEQIRTGDVTLQFRRWRRPTVKATGTLLTKVGQLAIEAVDLVDGAQITRADARRAGYADLAGLRADKPKRTGENSYVSSPCSCMYDFAANCMLATGGSKRPLQIL